MTIMKKKWPQALFPITTSSLVKLAHLTMHGGETWYTCVFQRFHDNHEEMASGTFSVTTSKLANHAMHGSETWYACHFHDNHEQKWPQALFDQERLLHFSNLQTIQCKKVTLRMHVHFSISMTTMNQEWPQALFPITTSSPFNTCILHTAALINTESIH